MTIRPLAAAAILLALATAACDVKVGEGGHLSFDVAEGKATDEWVRRYTIRPGGRLDIVNTYGGIEAFAAKGAEVEVTAVRELRMRTPEEAKEAIKGIEMIESASPDQVRIESPVRQPGQDQGLGRGYLTVNYRIGVPPGLIVTLKTENGSVQIQDVDAQVTARTTNGGVTARGVPGPLDARTVNGGINVELSGVLKGAVTVEGVNGGVRIDVPAGLDAELDLHAVNGGVSVDGDVEKVLTATQKERLILRGRLNKGGPKIEAQIVNGGVRVTSDSR